MKIRTKFGRWEVISEEYTTDSNHNKMWLCYDEKQNVLSYVYGKDLKTGNSKGARGGRDYNRKHNLPKYVHPNYNKGYAKYKVQVKNKYLGNKILGYFTSLKKAKSVAKRYYGRI